MLEQETIESRSELEESVDSNGEILSQRDFAHTPFSETAWEVVGERIPDLGFLPMEIEIMPSDLTKADPMFFDFGGGVRQSGETFPHAGQVREAPAPVEPEIDEAMLEQVRAEAFEAGRLQGIEEGKSVAITETTEIADQNHQRFVEFQKQLLSQLQLLASRTERSAFELALSVSKKILTTTADIKPDYILDVIRHALQSCGANNPLRIRVSPQDYEFLQIIGLPPDLSTEETGVSYLADENVSTGCIVETDFGEIDLRLEHMWQQVRENLYDVVK